MHIGIPTKHTRIVGKSQGYKGLPIRDMTMMDPTTGHTTNVMVTAWLPTPDEIDAIVKGSPIYVELFGTVPPPMRVGAKDPAL